MENMVSAVVLPRPLKGGHVLGAFHHADDAVIPPVIPADRADVLLRQILTDCTVVYRMLCL